MGASCFNHWKRQFFRLYFPPVSEKISRFDGKASIYASSRPTYPVQTLRQILEVTGLPPDVIVYDLGAGTGLFSKVLLEHFHQVHLVEPNAEMRSEAAMSLPPHRIKVIDASAEAFSEEPHSIDLITTAQAFHWFDRTKAIAHWRQILKPEGWVAVIWNTRLLSSPFAQEVGSLLQSLIENSPQHDIPQELADEEVLSFFQNAQVLTAAHATPLTEQELCNLVLSRSYSPLPCDRIFPKVIAQARDIHARYQSEGYVEMPYQTKLFIGRI